jgi:serine/threonine protein kinase/tetratricopeptide (TPR) repeat protein
MDADRWASLKNHFQESVDLSPAEQSRRITEVMATDSELGGRLEELLRADTTVDSALHRFDAFQPPSAITSSGVATSTASPSAGRADEFVDPFGLTGRRVSHFQVHEVLGHGGMGVVYRADDIHLDRAVALKFLLPHLTLATSAKERFQGEARAASALDHPNICTVHETGEIEHGQLFIAMAYYGGETLKDRLSRTERLPIDAALRITRETLQGLSAAHAAGIVHRDLKPANLMFTPAGLLKILDFGLAKVRDPGLSKPDLRPGSVAYMSPEQLRGDPLDHRTDLWSLGVVLFEMLTGQLPCGGGQELSTIYSTLHEQPPSPSLLRSDIPSKVDDLVGKLLARDPEDRYATAEAVLADLSSIGTEAGGVPAKPWLNGLSAGGRWGLATAGIIVVSLAAVAAMRGRLPATSDSPEAPSDLFGVSSRSAVQPSIAVLPFADMSPTRDQEYFADGISEEVLNALARIPELRVSARTSSFSFKGRNLPIGDIARELGVGAVLEGSVRRVGDRIRINTQLIDARSDLHLWSQTFDTEVGNIFTIEAEIASRVAAALEVEFAAGSRPGGPRPPANMAAHDLYLRGLFHWNRRSAIDLGHAIDFFEEAARLDPNYARAHAGLALAYTVLPLHFTDPPSTAEVFAKAEAAARRALAIDPSVGEARAALGYAYHWQWRWEDADREFRQAIALSPANATVYQWYGEHLYMMGSMEEGEEMMRHAVRLDPLSLVAQNDLGIFLIFARRYDEAIAQLERTYSMDTGFSLPLFLLHTVHLTVGNTEESERTGRRWAELSGASDPDEIATLVRGGAQPDELPAALQILARWEQAPAPRWVNIAHYYQYLDQTDLALAALERGLKLHEPMMVTIKSAPWADPLRGDPRFERIVAQMNFP